MNDACDVASSRALSKLPCFQSSRHGLKKICQLRGSVSRERKEGRGSQRERERGGGGEGGRERERVDRFHLTL